MHGTLLHKMLPIRTSLKHAMGKVWVVDLGGSIWLTWIDVDPDMVESPHAHLHVSTVEVW